jgi:hypothetical protein
MSTGLTCLNTQLPSRAAFSRWYVWRYTHQQRRALITPVCTAVNSHTSKGHQRRILLCTPSPRAATRSPGFFPQEIPDPALAATPAASSMGCPRCSCRVRWRADGPAPCHSQRVRARHRFRKHPHRYPMHPVHPWADRIEALIATCTSCTSPVQPSSRTLALPRVPVRAHGVRGSSMVGYIQPLKICNPREPT